MRGVGEGTSTPLNGVAVSGGAFGRVNGRAGAVGDDETTGPGDVGRGGGGELVEVDSGVERNGGAGVGVGAGRGGINSTDGYKDDRLVSISHLKRGCGKAYWLGEPYLR